MFIKLNHFNTKIEIIITLENSKNKINLNTIHQVIPRTQRLKEKEGEKK